MAHSWTWILLVLSWYRQGKRLRPSQLLCTESRHSSLRLWKLAVYFQFSFNFPVYCILVENGTCICDFVYAGEELLLATSAYAQKVYLSWASFINSSQESVHSLRVSKGREWKMRFFSFQFFTRARKWKVILKKWESFILSIKRQEKQTKMEREKQALTQVFHTRSPLNFHLGSWIEDTEIDSLLVTPKSPILVCICTCPVLQGLSIRIFLWH